jgi:hypothetical protein
MRQGKLLLFMTQPVSPTRERDNEAGRLLGKDAS